VLADDSKLQIIIQILTIKVGFLEPLNQVVLNLLGKLVNNIHSKPKHSPKVELFVKFDSNKPHWADLTKLVLIFMSNSLP